MKFRPLHDRVLVQREESEEKTAGGMTQKKKLKLLRNNSIQVLLPEVKDTTKLLIFGLELMNK